MLETRCHSTRHFPFAILVIASALGLSATAKPQPSTQVKGKSAVSIQNVQEPIREINFSQLHVRYQPEPPEYPEVAKAQRIQGTVKVEVILGKDGVPKYVTAISGPIILRSSAERYARHWRFDPVTVKAKNTKSKKIFNQPIDARFYLTMPYKLQ